MPRIPKSFTLKEILNWADGHMKQLPKKIQDQIEEGNVYDAFKMGLITGVINGICEFSKDGVTGIENICSERRHD